MLGTAIVIETRRMVRRGGVVRFANHDFHATALARYDGQRVTVQVTADKDILDVFLNGRLCVTPADAPTTTGTTWMEQPPLSRRRPKGAAAPTGQHLRARRPSRARPIITTTSWARP